MASRKSGSGKSVAVNVGNTWVHVASEDIAAFKAAIGDGVPVEIRARTELLLDENGAPRVRTFKKRDGSSGTGPDIRVRYWFRPPGDDPLADLVGEEAAASSPTTGDEPEA
jgi:hypothetical protein